MSRNAQVNAGPPLVGNHGLAPPAASSGDGRAVESSSPTRSWANVMGSPGRGEGPPGGGRGILDLLPNPGSTWGARACRRGRATPPTGPGLRWWPPQPGARARGGVVAQGTTGTREQVTHHITPLLCSSPLFCDNNVVFITKWTIVKLVHIPNFQKKMKPP